MVSGHCFYNWDDSCVHWLYFPSIQNNQQLIFLIHFLSNSWPDKVGVGMEIRETVVKMVHTKIMHQRKQNDSKNVAVVATNAMKFITHFFEKQSLSVMFFCFPDPHFKGKNARKRIITTSLLDHYAYLLQVLNTSEFIENTHSISTEFD